MPYSESLAFRIRDVLMGQRGFTEKKMFGGVGFLLYGNMCVGIWHTSLIVRLGVEQAAAALKEDYVAEFAPTGRPMKGWVVVEADGLETDDQLRGWIELAVQFVETLPRK
jgi:TfoX/Sxy family transcriptional regulator of competence genes